MKKTPANLSSLTDTRNSAKLHIFHWVVIVFSLLLTIVAWNFSKKQLEEKTDNKFNREADQVLELISERLQKYEDALWSGVAAIKANGGQISYKEWKTFSTSLRLELKYPGINGIGIVDYVTAADFDDYILKIRRQIPEFKVHPEREAEDYWPITFIEPLTSNARALGLDMGHEKNRLTAAKKARDTGTAQITGPIILIQDSGMTPGFLFYAPYYKQGLLNRENGRQEHLAGLVYAPFVVRQLMAGTLEKAKRHVGIKIVDDNEVL